MHQPGVLAVLDPDEVVGPHPVGQGDGGSGAVGIVGDGGAAGARVEVDEQVACRVPVGAGPGEPERAVVPRGVEPLRLGDGGAGGGVLGDLVVGGYLGAAGVQPAVVGQIADVVGRVGAVHVDRPDHPVGSVAVGIHHHHVGVHLRRLVHHLAVGADGGAVGGQAGGIGVGGGPPGAVGGDAGAVRGAGPGDDQRRRGLVDRLARGEGVADPQAVGVGDGDGDGLGRADVHRDGAGDDRRVACAVGGPKGQGVDAGVGPIVQIPGQPPAVGDVGPHPVPAVDGDLYPLRADRLGVLTGEEHPSRRELVGGGEDQGVDLDAGRGPIHRDGDGLEVRLERAAPIPRPAFQPIGPLVERGPGSRPHRVGDGGGDGPDVGSEEVPVHRDRDGGQTVDGVGADVEGDGAGGGDGGFVGGGEDGRGDGRRGVAGGEGAGDGLAVGVGVAGAEGGLGGGEAVADAGGREPVEAGGVADRLAPPRIVVGLPILRLQGADELVAVGGEVEVLRAAFVGRLRGAARAPIGHRDRRPRRGGVDLPLPLGPGGLVVVPVAQPVGAAQVDGVEALQVGGDPVGPGGGDGADRGDGRRQPVLRILSGRGVGDLEGPHPDGDRAGVGDDAGDEEGLGDGGGGGAGVAHVGDGRGGVHPEGDLGVGRLGGLVAHPVGGADGEGVVAGGVVQRRAVVLEVRQAVIQRPVGQGEGRRLPTGAVGGEDRFDRVHARGGRPDVVDRADEGDDPAVVGVSARADDLAGGGGGDVDGRRDAVEVDGDGRLRPDVAHRVRGADGEGVGAVGQAAHVPGVGPRFGPLRLLPRAVVHAYLHLVDVGGGVGRVAADDQRSGHGDELAVG